MFHLLGFLFIIVIAVLLIGLTVVGSILRAIFGFGRRSSQTTTHTYSTGRRHYHASDIDNEEEATAQESNSKHKKIFSDEEGEYIDFEEVKKND